MNHKRGRPKSRRAGCLMCKPWKVSGEGKEKLSATRFSDARRRLFARKEIQEATTRP